MDDGWEDVRQFALSGRTITAIAGLLLLIAGALYFYYVRGVGISPQISAPAAIERAGRVHSYTFGVSAAMPTPRTEVASAVLAGKIYVIGGFDGLGRTVARDRVEDIAGMSDDDVEALLLKRLESL